MFYVLFPVLYTFFIKHINRTFDLDQLEFMAKFYLFIYVVFMAKYGRNFSFSLQSFNMKDLGVFSGDGRIIHASSVFMMILPFLWYLDKFINTKKLKHFGLLLVCIIIILIHQHRSVWSGAIFALLIYFFITIRTNKKSIPKIWGLFFGVIVFFCFHISSYQLCFLIWLISLAKGLVIYLIPVNRKVPVVSGLSKEKYI